MVIAATAISISRVSIIMDIAATIMSSSRQQKIEIVMVSSAGDSRIADICLEASLLCCLWISCAFYSVNNRFVEVVAVQWGW